MDREKMVFNACGVVAAVALVLGGFMAVVNGFEAPPWLLAGELAVLSMLAAACCFTKMLPALLPWLRLKPVQGTLLVVGGVLAVYVPPQFVVSVVLLALGSRLVWAEACKLADAEKRTLTTGTTLAKAGGDTLPDKAEPAATLVARPEVIATPRITRIGSIELVLGDD